ncbi:uncharacterized protein BDZ99DRAFT_60261 [Mytilinidion resinicola]|uniref:CBM-cenC domain-containing protein n=1 Tax=Mytilinidion resinicola TaxID=574789 RepID=A0A6A6YIM7_9PEZI|nr:uncharacterized protein BDZ99DRAFT_60261 [Mytilinidion resinicola]KAF2808650.1 hypothetical protein BDZ99DRAFT_60261 [Mytilinidion resinicola]
MLQVSFAQFAALLAIAPSLIAAVPTLAAPSTTTTTTATPSALSCPASDGQTITVGTDSFEIQCGVDYYGGDLSLSWETSLENCIATCESTTGCIIVSYNGAACYMKNQDDGPQTNANIWAAKKVGAVACPAADGSTYTARDGAVYKIECSADRYGSDLDIAWVSDLPSCLEACEATAGCVDVSYRFGTPGPCYMKYSYTQDVRTDSGIWGAYRVSAPSSSTTTSSAAATSSTSSAAATSSTSSAAATSSTSSAAASSTTSSTSSATPTPTAIGCGLINDPSFENPGATTPDWSTISTLHTGGAQAPYVALSLAEGTSGSKDGTHVAYIATYGTGDSATIGNTILRLTAGVTYSVSFWQRRNSNGKVVISIDGTAVLTTPAVPDTAWYQNTFTFTATSDTAALTITAASVVSSNGFMWDAFTIAPVGVVCTPATTTTTVPA